MEEATGLKLDTLVNAYAVKGAKYSEEEPEGFDWLVDHPQHCVLGSVKGLGICNYKGTVTLLWNGKAFMIHPKGEPYEDENGRTAWERGDQYIGEKDDGTLYAAKAITYPNSVGSMMLLLTFDKKIYVGVGGYGIGDHWWKDKDGYEYLYPGDRWEEKFQQWYWSGEGCAEDMKKHNLTEDQEYDPIGLKPNREPWPNCEEWKKRVSLWATEILRAKGEL